MVAPKFIAALLLLGAIGVHSTERSSAQTRAFQRMNPCPSTGQRRGPCRGYVVDHVEPLCAGGADRPENMQWQTRADAHAKDVEEWRRCRALRRQR